MCRDKAFAVLLASAVENPGIVTPHQHPLKYAKPLFRHFKILLLASMVERDRILSDRRDRLPHQSGSFKESPKICCVRRGPPVLGYRRQGDSR
jgi:hypothetical protein